MLEVRHDLGAAVLSVRGEIDVDTAPDLEAALSLMLRSGVEHLTIDFSAVTFIDSSGLYVLARAGRQAKDRLPVVIRNVGRHVGKVLALSGLERVITISWPNDDGDFDDDGGPSRDADIIKLPR